MIKKDNAQLYTVEGIIAGILMFLVVLFVLKGTPLSFSTSSASNKNVEAQLELTGQDILTILDYGHEGDDSHLKEAIMVWSGAEFQGQRDTVIPSPLKEKLADPLREALGNDGIVYNLEVSYNNNTRNSTSPLLSRRMLWNGNPSDNAVTVTKKVVLHNGDLKDANLRAFIKDMDGNGTGYTDTEFYNLITVRLTLWRI